MAATLAIAPSFEVSVSRSSLYIRAFWWELFASLGRPDGAPLCELARWESGRGWGLLLGPLSVDAGRA